MTKEITIKRTQVYILPATTPDGYELHTVRVRAWADGQTYEPRDHQSVKGGLLYDGGICIGRVPADETAISGPWVDRLESYDYQRPVFREGYSDRRWVPIRGGTR